MAIAWTPSVEVVDSATRLINFSAVRYDSEDPDNPVTYTVRNVHVATVEQRLAVLQDVLAQRDAVAAEKARLATLKVITGSLEVQAKVYLEESEV